MRKSIEIRTFNKHLEQLQREHLFFHTDEQVGPDYQGSFNWVANFQGEQIIIPQKSIHIDPEPDDFELPNGVLTSKEEILKQLSDHLDEELA